MINWQKVKTALEWARLGKFVFDVFVAVFSLSLIKKLLTYVPQVPKDWATIIAWAAAALSTTYVAGYEKVIRSLASEKDFVLGIDCC